MMKSRYLLPFSFIYLMTTVTARALQPRQDVEAQALTKCPDGLPFSCQANTICLPTTAQNTSVICCPKGSDCGVIGQIPCDISQQNGDDYPNNQVHSTELDAVLPTCGNLCCPLGFNCAGNLCVVQPKTGTTSSKPSMVPPVATGQAGTAAAPYSTGTISPIAAPLQTNEDHSNKKAIAIGVPLALLAAALIGLVVIFLLKRRRRQHEAKNYMNEKPRRRMSSHSSEFMGRTPRPLSPQQHYVAPMSGPSSHSRSHSEPQASAPVKSNASVVSEPMWNTQLNGGAPLHRTDFLLRRGSCETGYEDKVKPSWSTRTKDRPKSLRFLTLGNRSATAPHKTPVRKGSRRNTRLDPMFSTAQRFGLPISPSPGRNKLPVSVSRGPRSDENLAKVIKLEGKSVNSGEAKHITNATPSPKKAKKMRLRDRSESARRPLVENVEGASREASVDRTTERKVRGQSLERQDSDASATTIESDCSARSASDNQRGRGTHTPNASSETINVLLPPPSVFQTPPPASVRTPTGAESRAKPAAEMVEVRRDTTFEDMMSRAGWRKSEWLNSGK